MAADGAVTMPLGDLDEFRLLRSLGHGGMGAVFLGHDTILDRLVAIKVVRARVVDEASRLRFLTEARAIARLSHPNVVTIFRTATTRDGQPYIAQEWISGTSLDRMPRPIAPGRAAEIGLGIARGLAAAHRRGILHRDIKPANVMIDESGTPKLLDFGLAKLSWAEHAPGALGELRAAARGSERAAPRGLPFDSPELGHPVSASGEAADAVAATAAAPLASTVDLPAAARAAADAVTAAAPVDPAEPVDHTVTGTVLGTPRYLAPEVWAGRPASARSDLYSFGALLYELVAGAPPHAEDDRDALQHAVLHGPAPRSLAELVPAVDPDLADLVADCLARDPSSRPESADQIAHRLDRILTGAPPLPGGNPYPGLAHFDADHRAVFYGRGADVNAVVDRLRGESVVAVAGDSGIGKSSLCRAGVIPAIEGGALGDLRSWRSRSLVVGRRAPAALREALGLGELSSHASGEELSAGLGVDASQGLLLFIDQFEEVLTAGDPASAAEAARLLAALAERVAGLKIVIAVRGDFLTRVASLPELGPILTRSLHLLRVLGPADVREAVVGPARAMGVRFDGEGTIAQLTSAVGDDAGALPLLQFALAELWQRRDVERGVIRHGALEQIGGVAGGLARHADSVLTALGAEERAAARRILLALVTAEGTRAGRERGELVSAGDSTAAAALEALVRGRLLVARDSAAGEPSYTLAHDSLIKAWTTLRGWLDDAAGQRGLRTRLSAAADEWDRRRRRSDLLWSRAQLAETAALDELTERDRSFLAASRRAIRLRWTLWIALTAAMPAAIIATWLGYRLHDQAWRNRIVAAHVAAADDESRDGEQAVIEMHARWAHAMEAFERNDSDEAEKRWGRFLASLLDADGAYRRAAVELETALLADGTRLDVRARMAQVIYQRALLAEAEGDEHAAADLVKRLRAYDDGSLIARWHEPAVLSISAPGAVHIEVRSYVGRDGRLVLGAAVASGTSEALQASLPPGSYLVKLRGRDHLEVPAPVLLSRGERLTLELPLPLASQIPAGFVYVPAGRFLYGSRDDEFLRRDFLATAPLHVATTGPYLIARHEVTFADWMAYLADLSPNEREERRPRTIQGGNLSIRLEGDGPFTLAVERPQGPQRLAEGERLIFPDRSVRREVRWERMPVIGVNFDGARSYADWLARTGRVAGARLCSDAEWERAARGADGRIFPHGARIEQDDANIDVTYSRRLLAYGPDEVGSHPASDSPFGVADLVGNVWEWVAGPGDKVVFRGGGWYHGAASALSTNRDIGDPSMRSPFAGVRVCADAPAMTRR